MKEFYTISKNETTEIIEKKSKFIADIYPVKNVEEAENKIKEIKKKYYDATKKAIQKSELLFQKDGFEIELETDYSNLENFKYYCKSNDINIINIDYSENIRIKIEMEKEKKDIFLKNIEEQKINKIRIVELCRKIVNIVVNK